MAARSAPPGSVVADDQFAGGTAMRALMLLAIGGFGIALAVALARLPDDYPGLRDAAMAALADHPVANPVTGVLLDFRAYDTLLEVAVLMLAALGVLRHRGRAGRPLHAEPPVRGSIVLDMLARLLVPLMVLVAVYLLWAGTTAAGGAFQGGALLGAAGVLLFLANIGRVWAADTIAVRAAIAGGFAVFLAVGLAPAFGGRFLDYPAGWTYALILIIETTLTLSIGAVLAVLYCVSARTLERAQ